MTILAITGGEDKMKLLIRFIANEVYYIKNAKWLGKLLRAKEMEDLVGRQIMKDYLKEYGIRC